VAIKVAFCDQRKLANFSSTSSSSKLERKQQQVRARRWPIYAQIPGLRTWAANQVRPQAQISCSIHAEKYSTIINFDTRLQESLRLCLVGFSALPCIKMPKMIGKIAKEIRKRLWRPILRLTWRPRPVPYPYFLWPARKMEKVYVKATLALVDELCG